MKLVFNLNNKESFMKKMIAIILVSLALTSCASKNENYPREYQVGAYLWVQYSAEYKALTYQAYNVAKMVIENDLKTAQKKNSKKRAVVFDIDETILDNSFTGADEIVNKVTWHEGLFGEWVKLKQAVAIPGAKDFIDYLNSKNIEVFLVSNRRLAWTDDTYENLIAQGFKVKKENVVLMGDEKTKEPRRLEILKKHEIIMLVGDNLLDFHKAFDHASMELRSNLVDQFRSDFGAKFIVLPNPMYGDWENTLPKDKSRIELLKVTP